MTKDEIKKMIAYFRAYYGGFLEDMDIPTVVNAWYEIFKDENKDIVAVASRNYVLENKYPPTVAGIVEQINLIKSPHSADDLFALIMKAAQNGTYGSVEEFNKLPPECQAFVGSPSGLKELAQIDPGTMATVVKGQFHKRVDAIRQHNTIQNGLPMEVKQAIAESKQKMLMEGE